MSGNKIGGLKAAKKNKERDPDFYFKNGQKGGSTVTPNTKKKGYGTHRDKARESGRKGGVATFRKHSLDNTDVPQAQPESENRGPQVI